MESVLGNSNTTEAVSSHTAYDFSCGVEFSSVKDLQETVGYAYDYGYQFTVVPIAHPRFNRDFSEVSLNNGYSNKSAFTRSDFLLSSEYWKSVIVGKTSENLDLDSPDHDIRVNSVKVFKQEVSWAAHLSLSSIIIPPPTCPLSPNYAHVVNQTLKSLMFMKVWVRIPLVSPKQSLDIQYNSSGSSNSGNTWEWWNNLRTLCENSPNLFPVLELTTNLPSEEQLLQWLGEPIKCIIIPTSIFLTNAAGFPTLSRAHQKFLKKVFKFNIQFILSGNTTDYMKDYFRYLEFLHANQQPLGSNDYFELPYLDFLQAPLQPLMDNLQSQVYEVFEKDPIKYSQYQLAIKKALLERGIGEPNAPKIIMVVGAGRGPLVKCAIEASKEAKAHVKVFAVEKNPNAIVTLRNRILLENWQDLVTVIDCDMRDWQTDYRADIMVSELLGSFGDNELSPECLDGAQRYLKADTGISIPYWYTSYVAPISSSHLHNQVATFGEPKHFETPYVVKPHNFHQLAESKPLFTFTHPNRSKLIDNTRYDTLEFDIDIESTTLHGFIGYFDCCLYSDVHISINPKNFSTAMFSWFPIYFPIKEPMYIPPPTSPYTKSKISVSFWRSNNRSKVWYEWAVVAPFVSPIHNVSGRSYYIGL
ncbi:hypothetical protein CYY_001531 [Polysphondylium violaceum]|uniref:Protein arginine N-methyltransferase n=1 Tax=Polysphondylium violaceum TaxID=133409 RepID=A0A8J4UW38_9MYCE|nr:hypothetical protein CYY_001531 [Polysphondylium violaceum]